MTTCIYDGALIHICRPSDQHYIRRVMHCPTCDRRRRFVVLVAEWYDPLFTCCACGDSFATEGRLERPFARGWRQKASARARRAWNAA